MAAKRTTPEPGPKPDYAVVGDHLYAQTNEGEIRVDLRIPIKKLELFMDMGELDIPEQKMLRYMMDNILDPDDTATLEGMKDGAKAIEILGKYSEALGDRMGANMGESKPSMRSSESTEAPSATTSDTPSE